MEKKPSNNIILFEKDSIIVKSLDEVLNLLDEGWLVEEEISGDIFIMSKDSEKTPIEMRG